jgi:hypothetical protein
MPKTQFWEGIKISGNPLLGAYVTEFSVELGNEDGSVSKMWKITVVKDDKSTRAQTAKTILTYRLNDSNLHPPARHLRIIPKKWVGPKPCLRFEAFFY